MGDGGEGIILDDMSAEEVEKMAKAQKEQGVKAEKVSKKRFQDMEKAEKPEATETPDNGSESTDEGEEAQDSTEGDGEDDNGNAGESGEGEDGADGEANGEAEDGNGLDHEGVAKENREQEFDMEGSEADALFAELTEAIDLEAQQAVDLEHDFKEEAGEVAEQMDDTRIKHHEIQITHTTEELVDKGVEDVERWEDEYNQTIKQHKTQITTMKNELRRLIKGRNTKYTDGLKRGDLDDRKLWQARTTDRLFKKRDQPKRAEANVLILVDASGSMGCGTRATSASECAAVITEVMDDLGFGCEVVDFNSGGSNRGGYTNVRVRKSMKAPLNRITKAAIRSPYVGSENSDGYAVQWSLDRLQQFKGNRILFVISDGQPCGPYDSTHSNASAHLKAVVANAPKDIALFSIGIDGMDTSKFYPNGASCNAHELTTKAMPIIRKMLRKVKAV
jgi:cobalamin biosynthesis protein CobT